MTRSARSVRTYATALGLSAATLAVSLVSTPLLLRWLGEERLGAFRAASDWVGYLSLCEMGLGGAVLAVLARASVRGPEAIRDTMATAFRSFRWVAAAMLPAALTLSLVIDRLVPASGALATDLRLGICVAAGGILLVPLSPLRALLEATQRGYVVNALLVAQALVITALSVLFAYFSWGVRGQFLAVFAGAIVFHAGLFWRATRACHGVARTMIGHPAGGEAAEELWRLNLPTLAVSLAGRVGFLTDNIVVAYFLGPAAVVPFFITQRLAVVVQSQLQSVGNSTWAALAELHHRGDKEVLGRRVVELTRLVLVLGLSAVVPVCAFNRQFVALWVGGGRYGGPLLTGLAAANAVMLAICSLWGWVFSGTGRVSQLARVTMCSAVMNVVLSLVCTARFGLIGPVLGTTASLMLVHGWWQVLLLRRHFAVSARSLLGGILRPVLIAVPYLGVTYLMAQWDPFHSWVGLVTGMTAVGFGFLLLSWWIAFNQAERSAWATRVASALKRKQAVGPDLATV